jgi:hypothetical protein
VLKRRRREKAGKERKGGRGPSASLGMTGAEAPVSAETEEKRKGGKRKKRRERSLGFARDDILKKM